MQDYPIRVEIRKAEDGDSLVGNENGLLKTDAQGSTEESGGFEGELTVNDAGDHIIYQVRGRRERLEERGDVRDIAYDQETQEWYGYVTKAMDQYGEQIIEGTEQELKSMEGVKPLYERDGTFTGKGIRFTVPVSGARLELFAGIELEETAPGQYKGVEVLRENGRVVRIRNSNTGAHKEIQVIGKRRQVQGFLYGMQCLWKMSRWTCISSTWKTCRGPPPFPMGWRTEDRRDSPFGRMRTRESFPYWMKMEIPSAMWTGRAEWPTSMMITEEKSPMLWMRQGKSSWSPPSRCWKTAA